jgi:uncharacterized phosphosugar-binding protein
MLSERWLEKAEEIIEHIKKSQTENVKRAAEAIAKSIMGGHFCYAFGTGHSHMIIMELFPRYGGITGMCPMFSTPLNQFTRIIGDLGAGESGFLENTEKYGRIIVDDFYTIDENDCMIVCSHSGITPVAVEVALRAKEKGATVISISSIVHGKKMPARHSSGKKLYEVADIAIDTGVPLGDVMIDVPGLEEKIGPGSSLANIVIANMISCEVVEIMMKNNYKPKIVPYPGLTPNAEEKEKELIKEFRLRVAKHLP